MLPTRAAATVAGAGPLGRGSPRAARRGTGAGGSAGAPGARARERGGARAAPPPSPSFPEPSEPRPRGPLTPEQGAPRCGRPGARLRALAALQPVPGPGGPSRASAPRRSPARTPTPRLWDLRRPPPRRLPRPRLPLPLFQGTPGRPPPSRGERGDPGRRTPRRRPRPRRPAACAEFIVARAALGHRRARPHSRTRFKVVASRCERGGGRVRTLSLAPSSPFRQLRPAAPLLPPSGLAARMGLGSERPGGGSPPRHAIPAHPPLYLRPTAAAPSAVVRS